MSAHLRTGTLTNVSLHLPRRHDPPPVGLGPPRGSFRSWLLGLPWVGEARLADLRDISLYTIECDALHSRRIWAVTGMGYTSGSEGVGLVVPTELAITWCRAGWGVPVLTLATGHMLFDVDRVSIHDDRLEQLALVAYSYAFEFTDPDEGTPGGDPHTPG